MAGAQSLAHRPRIDRGNPLALASTGTCATIKCCCRLESEQWATACYAHEKARIEIGGSCLTHTSGHGNVGRPKLRDPLPRHSFVWIFNSNNDTTDTGTY
jgi:hypothetical protein